jgi:hypothetical protein
MSRGVSFLLALALVALAALVVLVLGDCGGPGR